MLSPVLLASAALASTPPTHPPSTDPGAATGSGVRHALAWADVDGDGLDDALVLHPGAPPTLLHNAGGGEFQDRSDLLDGLAGLPLVGAAWADFDGDGWADLVAVDGAGSVHLLQNLGEGPLLDVTDAVGLAELDPQLAADWTDFDGDEQADLVLFGAGGTQLLHNIGGSFVTVTEATGSPLHGAAAFGSVTVPVEGGAAGPGGATADARSAIAAIGGASAAPSATTIFSAPGDPSPGGVEMAAGLGCSISLDDTASGGCLRASSTPELGKLYPLSQNLFVNPGGLVGVGTTTPAAALHVDGGNVAVDPAAMWGDDVLVAELDAYLGLFSAPTGNWGSAITLAEVDATTGALADKWGIARLTSNAASRLRFTYGSDFNFAANPTVLTLEPGGNVGIGTTDPDTPLHVDHTGEQGQAVRVESASDGTALVVSSASDRAAWFHGSLTVGDDPSGFLPLAGVVLSEAGDSEGQIEVYGNSLQPVVHISSDATSDGRIDLRNGNGTKTVVIDSGDATDAGIIQLFDDSGTVRVFLDASNGGKGRITCDVLEVKGGADLVESFETREDEVEPGTVVTIDPELEGRLCVSSEAYDTKVAGVVSGAGGVLAGISLGRDALSGDTPVALSGRVYVKASAENGPIRAGDRLTTAATPGHAMRVTDAERAGGAVIGKAMGSLAEGTGLVLVLVNLQ